MTAVDELHSFKAKPKKKASDTTKASEATDIGYVDMLKAEVVLPKRVLQPMKSKNKT